MAYLSNYSANSQYVVKAFSALFGSGVTGDLIASGDTILTAGTSTTLVNVLLNNSVVLNSFPLYGANITDTAFAGALIDNMTKGSGVDATTIAGWKTAVAAALPSYPSRAAAVATLIDAVTSYSGTDTSLIALKTVIDNRAEVGAYAAQNGATTFSTLSALQAQTASVDTTAASVTAAQTGTAATGSTFTLTSGVDNVNGTAGNDTIIADNTDTTKLQLTVADTINGGAGTDTLKVYQAAATTAFPVVSVTGVEKLYLNGGALTALDASLIAGLTAVEIDSAVQSAAAGGTLTVTTTGQAITLSNQKGTVANGNNAAAVFTTKLTSTNDTAATVTLNKVANATHTQNVNGTGTSFTDTQTLDIAGAKVTSLSLASTGAANTLTLTNTGTKLDTLTITGDKSLTLTEAVSTVKVINASAATGNVAVDTSGGTANAALAFTGGAGNDKLTLAASALVSTQALDGGAGTDTLVIKDTAINGTTTTLNTAINKIVNFEILGFGGAAAVAADLSKVTAVTQFSVEAAIVGGNGAAATAGTVGALFSGEANTQSIILNAAVTGGNGGAAAGSSNANGGAGAAAVQVTPTLDNGSNAASITFSGVTITGGNGALKDGTGTDGNGGSALDLTSFEAVTLVSNANAAGTVTTNTLTAGAGAGAGTAGSGLLVGANATITVSGAAALNLGSIVSNPGQSTNNNLTLNAGNLTGDLTASTGAGNDVITGGSGVNNITLGGGADSVDLSKSVAKADVITVASATGTLKTGIAITGFTNALNTGDKLDLIGAASITTSGTGTVNTGLANAVTATINANGVASFSAVGSSAALGDYVDAVFAAINSAGNKVATFQFGSDTYVVEDNGTAGAFTAGADLVVKLVGVTGVAGLASASDATHIWVA